MHANGAQKEKRKIFYLYLKLGTIIKIITQFLLHCGNEYYIVINNNSIWNGRQLKKSTITATSDRKFNII